MPGEAKLQSSVVDILHDIDLLRESWALKESRVGWTCWFVMARNLVGFFRPGGSGDDVKAEHYVANPDTWASIFESSCTGVDLEGCYTDTNKVAAHLTYARAKMRARGAAPAPDPAVMECLLVLWDRFLEELPASRRSWFSSP